MKRILLLALFCFPLFLYAQSPIKWGKIPRADLAMTSYAADTSAGAVVLADIGSIELDFATGQTRVVFMHHRRIKILKPSGFKWADVRLLYRSKNQIDKLYAYKAQLIKPSGDKVVLKRSDFSTEQINDEWSSKNFSLPEVTEGAIIEYTYKIESKDFYTLPEWYFQDEIPVRYSQLSLTCPDFMDYALLYQGSINLDKQVDYYTGNVYYLKVLQTAPALKVALSGSTYPLRINQIIYTAQHVPAFKLEPYLPSKEYSIAHLRFQWRAIKDPTDNRVTSVMGTWEDLANDLYSDNYFGLQFAKSFWPYEMSLVVEGDLARSATAFDSVLVIYQHLQHHLSITEPIGIIADKDLVYLYMSERADAGEANLMLIGALRKIGIPAWPVLISTRSHGKVYREAPFLDQFNHVIVMAEVDGKQLFMDLSDEQYPPGYLPVRDLNYYGMLLDRDNPRWVDLPAQQSASIYLGDFSLNAEEGILEGHLECHFKGYAAFRQIKVAQDTDNTRRHWEEKLNEHYPSAKVDSVIYGAYDTLSDHFSVTVYCKLPDALRTSGDLSYLPLIGFSSFRNNPFEAETRNAPVFFPFLFKEKIVLSVHLPEGASIETVPESVSLKLPEGAGKFKYVVSTEERKIQWISTFQLKKLIFYPEEYSALRNFFSIYADKWEDAVGLSY